MFMNFKLDVGKTRTEGTYGKGKPNMRHFIEGHWRVQKEGINARSPPIRAWNVPYQGAFFHGMQDSGKLEFLVLSIYSVLAE